MPSHPYEPPAPPPATARLAAAAARSAPIRTEATGEPRLRTRKRKNGATTDRFYIAPEAIPPGSSYEWKRHTMFGAGDMAYDVEMAEQGWEPVDSKRHPNFMPNGYNGAVVRDGMILMERPMELTLEAQEENQRSAYLAVKTKEAQLAGTPVGTLDRLDPKISRGYEPLDPNAIPV